MTPDTPSKTPRWDELSELTNGSPWSQAGPVWDSEFKKLELELAQMTLLANSMLAAGSDNKARADRAEADLAAAQEQIAAKQRVIKTLCVDWAEDHTAMQNLAVKCGATKEETIGDSYGIPGIVDLAEMAIAKLNEQIAALKKLGVDPPIYAGYDPAVEERRRLMDENETLKARIAEMDGSRKDGAG